MMEKVKSAITVFISLVGPNAILAKLLLKLIDFAEIKPTEEELEQFATYILKRGIEARLQILDYTDPQSIENYALSSALNGNRTFKDMLFKVKEAIDAANKYQN
jgi:hypothetical protein